MYTDKTLAIDVRITMLDGVNFEADQTSLDAISVLFGDKIVHECTILQGNFLYENYENMWILSPPAVGAGVDYSYAIDPESYQYPGINYWNVDTRSVSTYYSEFKLAKALPYDDIDDVGLPLPDEKF